MESLINLIKESSMIGITYHTSPDGDALGSALALYKALNKLNKKVYIISKDVIPYAFSYLKASDIVSGECVKVLDNTDCLIALDCGNTERLSGELDLDNRTYKVINIDHHLSNDNYGDINYVDTSAAATAEIVYELIKNMNVEIDSDMAKCIYTALVTDTGSFRHSGTSNRTHKIAGEIIDTGIDFSSIHREIFDNKPVEKLKLYGKVFETLNMHHDNKICFMELTMEMLTSLGLEDGDTSDIISFGTQIDTVEVAALFKEGTEGTKVSLRSKRDLDVRKVAEVFGGGGHTKASGCMIKGSTIAEAKKLVLAKLEEQL